MEKHFCPYCMTPVPEGESCPACGLTAGTYTPSPHHLPPGTVLMDRYMVGRVLGEGGFGITYIGCDLRLELRVAIKEYYPVDRATRNCSVSMNVTSFIGASGSAYIRGKQKFLDEARIMARMDKQPEIVSVRDHFEANNTAYIVMEYVEGTNFKELVAQKGGRIPAEELLPVIEPLFRALSVMHANGLIHRDISPDNLMIENGKVKLLDFGCARDAVGGNETLTIALKHGYAPLEQYQQKGQGPWTDIYALSATIYYCLTGRVPPQALDRITEDGLILPRKLGVNITEKQEQALLKGLEIRPNRRFRTADELHAALYIPDPEPVTEEISEPTGEPEPQEPPEPPGTGERKTIEQPQQPETGESKPKSERKLWGAIGAAAVAAVVLLVIFIPKLINRGDNPSSLPVSASTEDTASVSSSAGTSEAPDEPDSSPDSGKLFGTGVTFRLSGREITEEMLRRAMDNDEYGAVLIPSGYEIKITGEEFVIDKPLLVSEGATLSLDQTATVEGKGYLKVEGNLQFSGILRLTGDDQYRLEVTETGSLNNCGLALLWMEDNHNLYLAEGGQMDGGVETLTLSEEKLFAKAVTVSSEEELTRALEQSPAAIIIDSETPITFTEGHAFTCPVKICEGVTVSAPVYEDDSWCGFSLEEDGCLVNYGSLTGALNIYGDSTVVNYGYLLADTEHDGSSLWMEGGRLLNCGQIDAGDVSRIWGGTMYNVDRLNSLDFYLVGGQMVNSGTVFLNVPIHAYGLPGDYDWKNTRSLEIDNGSRLINLGGITCQYGNEVENNGYLDNRGQMRFYERSRFRNDGILDNSGELTLDESVGSDPAYDAAYEGAYGTILNTGGGTIDSAADLGPRLYTMKEDIAGGGEVVEVEKPAELIAGLDNPDVSAVWVTGEVTLSGDTAVGKTLCIMDGGSLTMKNGAELRIEGENAALFILGGGKLQGSVFTVTDGAQVMNGGVFTFDGDSTLTVDGALFHSQSGSINFSSGCDTAVELRGGAVMNLVWTDLTSGSLPNSLVIRDNAAMNVYSELGTTGGAVELRDGGVLNLMADTTITQSEIRIEGGTLNNTARNLSLFSCGVLIGTEGNGGDFFNRMSTVTASASTYIENHGFMDTQGWDEHGFTLDGEMVNYGTFYSWAPLTVHGKLDNQGEIRTGRDISANVGGFTGNEPIME